jgi:hypothetical protein
LKLSIHPNDREHYDREADLLITRVREAPEEFQKEKPSANPDIHIDASVPVTGEVSTGWFNSDGDVIAQAFYEGTQMFGLFGEDYANLVRLAEKLKKSIKPRDAVSLKRLTELIFDWCKQKCRGANIPPMVTYALETCEPLIKAHEIWIPISHLYIESPFRFGSIVFRAVTKKMMDEWMESWLQHAKTAEEIHGVRLGIEKRRKRIQALAAATITVEAEPDSAYERAFKEVDKTVSLLRFFSPTNFSPRQICYSTPLGSQHEDRYVYLLVDNDQIMNYNSGFTHKSLPVWNLTNQYLTDWSSALTVLHALLQKEELTDFQSAVIDALILYSRTSLAKHVSDKLVYMLVALESIFLKDLNEPITDNISLRMAFMQNVSVPERRDIISNVKKAYSLRSAYIHHGQSIGIDDEKILKSFMLNAWCSVAALIPMAATDITKEQFYESFENRRLSG